MVLHMTGLILAALGVGIEKCFGIQSFKHRRVKADVAATASSVNKTLQHTHAHTHTHAKTFEKSNSNLHR